MSSAKESYWILLGKRSNVKLTFKLISPPLGCKSSLTWSSIKSEARICRFVFPGMKTDVKVRKFVRKHVRNEYLEKGARKNKGDPKEHGTNTKTFVKSQSAYQLNQLVSIEPMMLSLFTRRWKRFRRFDIPPWEDYRESGIQTSKWTIGRW